jgi:hypothetical protein
MLRLPDIRHRFARMTSETLGEMFEAYDFAVDALERFRNKRPREDTLITEYGHLCREIEQEVVVYFIGRWSVRSRL